MKQSIFLLLCATQLVTGQLVLAKPPEVTKPGRYEERRVAEGQTVHLNCEASFAQKVEWKLSDATGDVLARDGNLELPNPTRNDTARYRCVASNDVATVIGPTTRVRTLYLDDFDNADDNLVFDLTTSVGRSFVLRRPPLVASEELKIKYSWYKDEQMKITSDSTHLVTDEGDLVVLDVTNSDFGRYKVIAQADDFPEVVSNVYTVSNNGESVDQSIVLNIIYSTQDRRIIESETPTPVVFECIPSIPQARTRWFLDGEPLNGEGNGISLSAQNTKLTMLNPTTFKKKGDHKLECKADAAMGRTFDQKTIFFDFIGRPQLRDLPTIQYNPLGSAMNIKCALKRNGQSPADIQWYFNGAPITSHKGKLQIDHLKHVNYGVYQCEATNDAGADLKTMWLLEGDAASQEEKEPESIETSTLPLKIHRDESVAQPRIVESPSDVAIHAGAESFTLTCLVAGEPTPTVKWIFNDLPLHTDSTKYDVIDGSLTVHEVKKSDHGEYRCEASNAFGSKKSQPALVTVDGDSLIEYGPTDQKSLIGTNVEFQCEVAKAYARRAQTEWYLNGMLLSTSGNSGLRISRNRKGSLIIRQVGPDNTGQYRCVVRVDGREEVATAELQIIEKPAMPERVVAELRNETTPAKVRLSWSEGFDGNEPIIKHAVEMRSLGPTGLWSDWSTIIDNIPKEDAKPCCHVDVEDLRPSVTAEFRVVASNKHGPGKPSLASANITMPQQPPSAAPRNLAASARSSNSIIVQWESPKEEHASGDVLGYVVRYRLAGYSSLSWNEKNLTSKDARNAIIEELITWREYEIQVAAYNKRGLGVFSDSIEVTTAEGAPTQAPKNVRMKVLSSTAVEVRFSAPDQQRVPGVNLGYKVEFWKGSPQNSVLHKQLIVDPDRRELTKIVENLEKFGHYNLTVLCFTTPGDGPRSNPIEVITEEDTPESVDSLSISEVMYNGAVITWAPPLKPNGVITKYTIRHWSAANPEVRTRQEVDGHTTTFTIEGLIPSTRYGVDVMASTKKGDGPAEETKFESGVPPELPGRPSGLSIGEIGATSVVLHFTPGFDGHTAIRQWIVEAKVADSSVFSTVYNVSAPKARSITVHNLRPYTQYHLRLIAENVKGRGGPSESSRMFETEQTNPESPSARLYAEPITATSIAVSWNPLLATQWNGQANGYLIVYKQIDDDDWKEIRTPALRSSEYTIQDLRPFTVFLVNVFAENAYGKSNATDPVEVKTYESVPSGAPQKIVATVEGSKSVLVKWEPVAEISTNGEILGYQVELVPERESLLADETKRIDVPGQATLITKVSDLRPFTRYNVYVSAYTIVGNGPKNPIAVAVETMEDVPTPPEAFQCSSVTENEVRLKWLPPSPSNGKITSYIVSYWKSHEPRSMAIDAPVLGNLLLFAATSLNPNTPYTFAIKALNSKGESGEALAEVVTTSVRVPVRNPPPPARDEQTQYSSDSVVIRWNERVAEDVEAPIRSVQVSYQKTNEEEWTYLEKKFDYSKKRASIGRLSPNSAYRFRIRYYGDFLDSAWSAESDWLKTLPAPPIAQPINVQAHPNDSTSLSLNWVVPHRSSWNADAVGYRIFYREYPSNSTWQVQELPLSATRQDAEETVLGDLLSFRHYIVRMRMFNSEGEGPFSVPVFVYVGYSTPKRNITNLVAEPKSSSSISVRWDAWDTPESETVTSFKVRYVPLVSVLAASEEETLIVDTNTCLLSDLRKFTEYQISVFAYNRAGEGKKAQVRTKTLEDVPGPVGVLRFTDILIDSVKVSWDEPSQPNGLVAGYIVNYKGYRMQEQFKNEDQQRTTRNEFTAVGLQEGITYYFVVWAETAAGKGEERSGNVTVGPSLDGPMPPTKPTVIQGQTTVTLQWAESLPTTNLVGHLIQAKRVSAAVEESLSVTQRREPRSIPSQNRPTHVIGEWITLRAVEGTAEKEQISYRELQPSSYYVFRVFSRNLRGVGMPSEESEQLFVPELIPDDPFYTTWWFLALVAMGAFVCIVIIVATLCVTGTNSKYRREKRARSVDSLQLADGNFASFQLKGTDASNLTRSRELPVRPGTTQSWLSDREPPAYGSVLNAPVASNGSTASPSVVNMYGLATDVIPPLPNAAAMQRLSALVGRDVRSGGSAYVTNNGRNSSHQNRSEYGGARSEYGNRSEYGRVEYGNRASMNAHDYDDSFDEEEVESVDGEVIRGAPPPPPSVPVPPHHPPPVPVTDDIAGHYGTTDDIRDDWRRVLECGDVVRSSSIPSSGAHHPPSSSAGRSSSQESNSDLNWPSHQAPSLTSGFSSFV